MTEPEDKIKSLGPGFVKWLLLSSGALFLLFIILSFTDIPYYAYHWLGTSNSKVEKEPELIVLLGGGGMPSADGFMRSYYSGEAYKKYPEARIIIALPFNEGDSLQQLRLMEKELIMRGVDSCCIEFEPLGFNTHSQAENIATKYAGAVSSILLVTSPEHMYRSVSTFKKAGFENVCGSATFERPPDEEKIKDNDESSDPRVKSVDLRYNVWSYMHYELLVMKEYCAITYYWIKGWI